MECLFNTDNIWLERAEEGSSQNDLVQVKTVKDYQAKEALS